MKMNMNLEACCFKLNIFSIMLHSLTCHISEELFHVSLDAYEVQGQLSSADSPVFGSVLSQSH
jgi:hypothetical protein